MRKKKEEKGGEEKGKICGKTKTLLYNLGIQGEEEKGKKREWEPISSPLFFSDAMQWGFGKGK